MVCFCTVVYSYYQGKEVCISFIVLYRIPFLFHRTFMAAVCYLCGMVVAKSLLCSLFPLLCLLHQKDCFKIKVALCFYCSVYLGITGIYTILSVLRVSLVFCRSYSIPLFAGDTNR